ncbi:serine protease [Streptomyces inusitatus]|nr:serine protease [Streptomyces inusitatus]
MTIPSAPRRSVLRALAVSVALVGGAIPASGTAASASAERPETYTLTINHLDRTGRATADYITGVHGLSGPNAGTSVKPHDASGTTVVRLPRGRYALDSTLHKSEPVDGIDWIVQPRLDLDRDTTVTVDARTTAAVDVRPPDRAAKLYVGMMVAEITHNGVTHHPNVSTGGAELRVAHLGPAAEPGSVRQWFDGHWEAGNGVYSLGYTFTGDRALTGLTRRPARRDLATVRVDAAATPGTSGYANVFVTPSGGPTVGYGGTVKTPGTSTHFVTPERGTWDFMYVTRDASGATARSYHADGVRVRAGETTKLTFDNAVFGPDLTGRPGAVREGRRIAVDLPLLADGEGRASTDQAPDETASFTLHRDGVPVAPEASTPGRAAFTVPPGRAAYRLTGTARRTGAPGTATRVTSAWTFASAATAGPTPLPLSAVRFSPGLSLTGTAPAGAALRIPVTVQGAAANGRTRSLTVSASTDGGATWTRLPVTRGAVTFRNPRADTGVSLRAELTDTDGNTLTQTIVDAYRTR